MVREEARPRKPWTARRHRPEQGGATVAAPFPASKLPTTILLLQFPWFTGYNSTNRIPTLLNSLGYACAQQLANFQIVAVVETQEMANCAHLCGHMCTCSPGEHRQFAQRNIAKHATGEHNLLFAHADMWINLNGWAQVLHRYGDHSISPHDGLLGTNYQATQSLCLHEVSHPLRMLYLHQGISHCT